MADTAKPEGKLRASTEASQVDLEAQNESSNPAVVWDSSPPTEVGSMDHAERGHSSSEEGATKPADVDPNLKTWDGENDPGNPHNWTVRTKVGITAVWVVGNIVTTIASSIFASGASLIEEEFNISSVVATLGVSLFLVVCNYISSYPVFSLLHFISDTRALVLSLRPPSRVIFQIP